MLWRRVAQDASRRWVKMGDSARGAVHVRSSGRGRRRMARCCEGEDRARASTALCVVLRGPRGVGV